MAQVDVGINFDFSSSTVFSVDSYTDSFYEFIPVDNIIFPLNYRVASDTEAFRAETTNIYSDYGDEVFTTTYDCVGFDPGIDFSFFSLNIKARSGQCADVSLIQEYRFRAYNTSLNSYVFWSAGVKDFSESITGYDPAYLQNITILSIISA